MTGLDGNGSGNRIKGVRDVARNVRTAERRSRVVKAEKGTKTKKKQKQKHRLLPLF